MSLKKNDMKSGGGIVGVNLIPALPLDTSNVVVMLNVCIMSADIFKPEVPGAYRL